MDGPRAMDSDVWGVDTDGESNENVGRDTDINATNGGGLPADLPVSRQVLPQNTECRRPRWLRYSSTSLREEPNDNPHTRASATSRPTIGISALMCHFRTCLNEMWDSGLEERLYMLYSYLANECRLYAGHHVPELANMGLRRLRQRPGGAWTGLETMGC